VSQRAKGRENVNTGNANQEAALHKLLDALNRVRGFSNVKYKIELTRVKLLVTLDLPNFPVISIGRGGGFDMPDIPSYPQRGTRDSLEFPGKTAFDACLFGDKYELLQNAKGR
jgi:hypothetical protein